MKNPIIFVEKSKNPKIGEVSAIYAPLTTCPGSCPFKKAGCYARNGNVNLHARRCTEQCDGMTQIEIARAEAETIRNMSGERPLRLHVSGDFYNAECAEIIDRAAGDYTAKHGKPVWAYTHNWRNIPRSVFKNIAILASCETRVQAVQAHIDGYNVALVIPDQTTPKDVTVCPALIKGITCCECKLCFKSDKRRRKPIGFWPHGAQKRSVQQIINEVTL